MQAASLGSKSLGHFFVVAKNRCQCFVLKLVLADGLPGVRSCCWDLLKGDVTLSFLGRTKYANSYISTMSCLTMQSISNKSFFVKLFEFDFFHVVMLCDCVRVFRCHTMKISVASITQFHGIEKTSMAKMTRSANHDHEVLNFFCPTCEFLVSLSLCCFRFVAAHARAFLHGKFDWETCFIFWDEYDGTQHFLYWKTVTTTGTTTTTARSHCVRCCTLLTTSRVVSRLLTRSGVSRRGLDILHGSGRLWQSGIAMVGHIVLADESSPMAPCRFC